MNAADLLKLSSPNLGTYDHDLNLARQRLAVAIETSGYLRDVRVITLYALKVAGAIVPGAFWANIKPCDGSKGFRLNVRVDAANGHAFLSFGSCTLSLDLRDADRQAADDAAAALAQAARKARVDAGRAQLLAEAAVRNATPSPGHLLLVHGDVLRLPYPPNQGISYYWHVGTIRGSALANGEDPAAAVAENARRREARETVQGPESEGGGQPAWCGDEYLFESGSMIAADGLTAAERHTLDLAGKGLGGKLVVANIGDRVELNGRVFVLALERGHWVKLLPVVQLLDADEETVRWEGPADVMVRDNREAVGAKRGEVTEVEIGLAQIMGRSDGDEDSVYLGGGAAEVTILRLLPPTRPANVSIPVPTVEARDRGGLLHAVCPSVAIARGAKAIAMASQGDTLWVWNDQLGWVICQDPGKAIGYFKGLAENIVPTYYGVLRPETPADKVLRRALGQV